MIHNHTYRVKKRIEHVCLEIDDHDAFMKRCQTFEVKIIQVPKEDKILTFILDYDNNLFEIKNKLI